MTKKRFMVLMVLLANALTITFIAGVAVYFTVGVQADISLAESGSDTKSAITPRGTKFEPISQWKFYGLGSLQADEAEGAVRLLESPGSKGVTLLSPETYGTKVTLSFKVKPLSFESVVVVLLSISDSARPGGLEIPAGYDGGIGLWTQGSVRNYFIAFHNTAHSRKPFIARDPGLVTIAEADYERVSENRWHDVEIGREGTKLWLKVNGRMVLACSDTRDGALPGGAIAFRLRGTANKTASCLIKDVIISKQ